MTVILIKLILSYLILSSSILLISYHPFISPPLLLLLPFPLVPSPPLPSPIFPSLPIIHASFPYCSLSRPAPSTTTSKNRPPRLVSKYGKKDTSSLVPDLIDTSKDCLGRLAGSPYGKIDGGVVVSPSSTRASSKARYVFYIGICGKRR